MHTGNVHILSSHGHQTNSVASTSKSDSGLRGARSRRQLRPCLLQTSQPGENGKTHSITELPGPSAARPLVQPASTLPNWPSSSRGSLHRATQLWGDSGALGSLTILPTSL